MYAAEELYIRGEMATRRHPELTLARHDILYSWGDFWLRPKPTTAITNKGNITLISGWLGWYSTGTGNQFSSFIYLISGAQAHLSNDMKVAPL